ncbi:uncharacterized protein [Miscanthus floridulus]|uniref:uncharacterized protein n=1 Tax=Miscanthus floridulus TaxID=154761 RepID=UPI003457DEB3
MVLIPTKFSISSLHHCSWHPVAGADVNFISPGGPIILMEAVNYGLIDIVKFLLEAGADPNIPDEDGRIPIIWAAVHGLLDHGGDPVMPDSMDSTPLHDTPDEGHCEVRLLLSKGVDVDAISSCGTPLHMAASRDQDQTLKILLEHCADPNKVVLQYFPPLLMSCRGRSLICMKLLIEASANVSFISPGGPIILMEAINYGLIEIVNFLLESGADPNIPDENGRLPIMLAATREKRELVEILLPQTKPIPSVPDWTVDGIIRAMKLIQSSEPRELVEKRLADAKSQGKEAFADGRYVAAAYYYMQAKEIDPHDATVFSNLSLCLLRLREGEQALAYARQCKALRPDWSKAWYREDMALSFLEDYNRAVNALHEALKLDPASNVSRASAPKVAGPRLRSS